MAGDDLTAPEGAVPARPVSPDRSDLQRLVDEQAALRRVAELVARGADEHELVLAVAGEASRLMAGRPTTLLRMDGERDATVVATSGDAPAPIGTRLAIGPDDEGTVAQILRTGRPARRDDYVGLRGRAYAHDDWGVESSVGVPIVVEERLWGMLGVTAAADGLPPDAEDRLQQFADLIAAALANAQARRALQQLADDQAALRRVAELVARSTPPEEVFAAVATEASRLIRDAPMILARFDGDYDVVVLAVRNGPAPVGTRVTFDPHTHPDVVRATGRAVRTDDHRTALDADLAESFGVRSSVAAPITIEGQVWGLLTATSDRPLPPGTEGRLTEFGELVAAAIANAESRAQLTASRARVVASADDARRRIGRDVHDGAQQRLVQSVVMLKLAHEALRDEGGRAADLVDESLRHVQRATSELSELVRGIMPAALTRGGLRVGLESLIGGLGLPVDLRIELPRLPTDVETTAYFIVAEALSNVVKHAGAQHAEVDVSVDSGAIVVVVRDDGVGGADRRDGTGLTGLIDRVEAADGAFDLHSPPGGGTVVRAVLPLPPVS
jgi:signal transduction histidine kinase